MTQPEGVSGFTWKQDRFCKITEDKAYGGPGYRFFDRICRKPIKKLTLRLKYS
jgi:hypothetical protein